jgi:hypothetical protein
VFSLCDYKVWIDTEIGEEAKNHLRRMVELNLMEEEFCARRMAERRRDTYFALQREMDHDEYKEKQEQERARKREKARRVKEAYERGGEEVLRRAKWPCLTQDLWTSLFHVYQCVVLNL